MAANPMQRITEHVVWMQPGPPDRPSLCAVTGERGTLMLDSGASDAHARLFLDGLRAFGVPAPRLVALTHWHWDHIFGAAEIAAPVICGAATARELARMAAYDWADPALDARVISGEEIAFCADNLKLELPEPRRVRVAPPDVIFDSALRIDLGGVTCRLQHVGGDHSADSAVIFVEPDGVLFLSDCLYDHIYAPIRHYTTARLFPLLDALARYDAAHYVEGHTTSVLSRAEYDELTGLMRLIGPLADAHPGDAEAITGAYRAATGREPAGDAPDLIRLFAAAPREA